MADYGNNSTGALQPDGIPDEQASSNIQAKITAAKDQADAAARAAYMGNQGALLIGSDGLLPTITPAQIAALDAANNKDKEDTSFPVLVTGAQQKTGGRPSDPVNFIQKGVKVGLDTLNDQGFLGVTDQNIVSKVVGLTGGKVEYSDTVYKAAVNQAAFNQKAGIPTSVEDVLELWDKGGLPENIRKYINGSGSGSGGAFSTTNKVVSLTNEGTARQVLNRALSSYLGREATDMENKMFLNALNVQEKKNPTITKTKGYSDGSGNTTQSQTVDGGFNRDDFATRFARSQEGYAEYQAATTYLDAFINALESNTRVI